MNDEDRKFVNELSARKMWTEYRDTVIPADAGPNQRSDMETTFYCGMFAMLANLLKLADADPDDETGSDVFQSLWDEIEDFMRTRADEMKHREMSVE